MAEQEGCRVYAGNLDFNTEQGTLADAFAEYGNVVDCKLITDRETGRSRGFGFITFDTQEAANRAVSDGQKDIDGRDVKVSIAQARNDSRGGGRGRGGYRGNSDGGYQQRSYGGDRGYGQQSYGGGGGYGGGDGHGRQGGGGGW
ncbi:glycine-rich RNA-binding, abscisic acid-inducible protein-like [Mizuhopecten yessoensis]|uniref:glycine-rich RNA-binding, abscisic acid-inducible protein-like n=1 Tax=Mizuhopecten yessoensis TaxID=6573 RepID=UPI000B459ABB|nr:glycine-rich RNA-binding, abscisic acid-inducible protein-like [Mizuhopecten yessoensis]